MANDIRSAILELIEEQRKSGSLQSGSILDRVSTKINPRDYPNYDQKVLTEWHELFRTGYLAWGMNLSNKNPPWFHVTEKGARTLERVSRDPSNPSGYLHHLQSKAKLNAVASSYLEEGLACFVSNHFKAASVMIGAASESLILEIRDAVVKKLEESNQSVNPHLRNWQTASVLKGLKGYFDSRPQFDPKLKVEYEAYWAAYAQQIRAVRNEAGHPTSIDPITEDVVHASFLIFPELATLANKLKAWIERS
jgi:hypothetical protein